MKMAVILSANTVALGVARSLGQMGVPVAVLRHGTGEVAHCSRYIQTSVASPHPEDSEGPFIDLLISNAGRFGGAILIPASDETLVAVSRNKGLLERHYQVACPEWEIVEQFIDKKFTYSLAEDHGVPVPRTVLPRSAIEVEEYGKALGFPLLAKPSQSHLFYRRFHQKMVVAENPHQLVECFRRAADAGLEMMLQEIIPGGDSEVANYNAYFSEGRALVEFTCQHVRNGPAGYGSTRVALSKEVPEIIEPGRRILKALGFYGFACIEFKRDSRDGVYKLMDVNGRHNLSTLLAVRCGINFPWLEYRHLTDGEVPSSSDFKKGVYWIDSARDIGYSFISHAREKYSLRQYIEPYLRPRVCAEWDWKDPAPFLKKCLVYGERYFKGLTSFRRVPRVPEEAFPSMSVPAGKFAHKGPV